MKKYLVESDGLYADRSVVAMTEVWVPDSVTEANFVETMQMASCVSSMPSGCYEPCTFDDDEFQALCRNFGLDADRTTQEDFLTMLKARDGRTQISASFAWLKERFGWDSRRVLTVNHKSDSDFRLEWPGHEATYRYKFSGERRTA